MQCPACDHEAPQADFGNPLRCPECGSYYEKAIELKQKRLLEAQSNTLRRADTPVSQPPVQKKKRSWIRWLFVGMMVIGLFNIILREPSSSSISGNQSSESVMQSKEKQESSKITQTADSSPGKDFVINSTVLKYDWRKSGDIVMVADFTVINGSYVDIKDVEIKCTNYGSSGTNVDSNTRTIYEVIPAGGRKTFKNFNMGFIHSQAVKSNCSIVDLKI